MSPDAALRHSKESNIRLPRNSSQGRQSEFSIKQPARVNQPVGSSQFQTKDKSGEVKFLGKEKKAG